MDSVFEIGFTDRARKSSRLCQTERDESRQRQSLTENRH